MSVKIEDYALIGNCRTTALISRTGSVDWLCFPRFDSPSCFTALLGTTDNGHWSICPQSGTTRISRRYYDGSLILETHFSTDEGEAILIDFMPTSLAHSSLVRIVAGVKGTVSFNLDLVIRFMYGNAVPWVEKLDGHTIFAVAGPDLLTLRTPVQLTSEGLRTVGTFTVKPGERIPFILTYESAITRPGPTFDPEAALIDTDLFWQEFSGRCPDVGPHTELVKRSLITLKSLTYLPTGGIVAAPTTSLPEQLGGGRNWDYRYCWLRDATMTLLAFMKLGYFDEATAWRDWLSRAVAGTPEQMQIMYGICGERQLAEAELPWLSGYEGSQPVRIGNAAAGQTGQTDRNFQQNVGASLKKYMPKCVVRPTMRSAAPTHLPRENKAARE